jgi:hypothetical protein
MPPSKQCTIHEGQLDEILFQVKDISTTMHEMTSAMAGDSEKKGFYDRVRDLEDDIKELKEKPKSYKNNIQFAMGVGMFLIALAGVLMAFLN